MAYNTVLYLFIFLPAVLILYGIAPQKIRWGVLLFAGYVFYWIVSGWLIVYILGTTIFTYYVGIFIEKLEKKYKKRALVLGVLSLLAVLLYLKYYNFFAENMNALIDAVCGVHVLDIKEIVLPIGISFYTLLAISYMADVYWGKREALHNPLKLALLLCFFPQIMEGPISIYSKTENTLWEGKPVKASNLSDGCVRIFWGLFKKMIIADRLYVPVQVIFESYTDYSGVSVAVAAIAYTVQLYMEFSECMDIVIGSAKLFGITLPENFKQPFASKNAAEFWRRWHITLGVWFKTYVFYPVSLSSVVKKWNRFGRKHLNKYITKIGVSALALFPVWFFNGLWHGPRWSYIFYGMYYFIILLGSIIVEPLRNKVLKACHINENVFWFKSLRIIKTWIIIFTGELFFRANGLRAGIHMFLSIFKNFEIRDLWNGTFLELGLDKADYIIIFVGCVVVAIVGIIKERNILTDIGLCRLSTPVRWVIYYALIMAVVIFGAYGVGYQQVDLIYAGF